MEQPELSERYYICTEGHIHSINHGYALQGIADCNPSNIIIAGLTARGQCPAAARPPQLLNKKRGK